MLTNPAGLARTCAALLLLLPSGSPWFTPQFGAEVDARLDTDAIGTLGGRVFRDVNNNGVFDCIGVSPCDSGLFGVTMIMSGTQSGQRHTVTTIGGGFYTFTALVSGTYQLIEQQPATHVDGVVTLGTQGGIIISRTQIELMYDAELPAAGYNFGELLPSTINGTVYVDVNGDGFQSTDPRLRNALLTLTGTTDMTQTVQITALTNSSGAYAFAGLRPGSYVISETQPAGLLDGAENAGSFGGVPDGGDRIISVTVSAVNNSNTIATGYNFGERAPVAGSIFRDDNNDGVYQVPPDQFIGGFSVVLSGTQSTGAAVQMTTAVSGGVWYFTNVVAGSYVVSEVQNTFYFDGLDNPGSDAVLIANDVVSFSYAAGQIITGITFAELGPSSLLAYAFHDQDVDDVYDCSIEGCEPLIAATFVLSGTDDLGQSVRLTLTSVADGAVTFQRLRPGTYDLLELQPAGYIDGADTPGQAGGVADGADGIRGIVLGANRSVVGYGFGERRAGLSGYIYHDTDNDGVRAAPGESGVSGVLVTLTGTTQPGDPVTRTATSNAQGAYVFSDLLTGTYHLHAAPAAGLLEGRATPGTIDGISRGSASLGTLMLTYTAGENGQEYNFGRLFPAQLRGLVYFDLGNDGGFGGGEATIANVIVRLSGIDDRGGNVSQTQQTLSDGSFAFAGLRPGIYTLTEQQPVDFLDGGDCWFFNGSCNAPQPWPDDDTFAGLALAPGINLASFRFGERKNGLTGRVFEDFNLNGLFDLGEGGVPDVSILLTGTNYLGQPVSMLAQTVGAGTYSFANLVTGTYRLQQVAQPATHLDGRERAGSLGGQVGPPLSDYIDFSFQSEVGPSYGTGYDFGEIVPNTLAGYVFYDVHNDGKFEWLGCDSNLLCTISNTDDLSYLQYSIDQPLDGPVSIVVSGTDDLSRTVWLTQSTVNGYYEFGMLRPGTYTVTELQRAIDVDGKTGRINAPGASVISNSVRGIVMTSNSRRGAVFGVLPSITGHVYRDDNDDGAYSPVSAGGCISPELGIPNVTVRVIGNDIFNQSVNLATTTFSPNPIGSQCDRGLFYFGSLVTGTYALSETQPAGYADGREGVGAFGGLTTTNDLIDRIVFTPGQTITGYTFGELQNVISGRVFLDRNGNGLFDAGDDGQLIGNSTIRLTGVDDLAQPVSRTLLTNGPYTFAALRPGTYTVTQLSAPPGYLDGPEQLGTGAGGSIVANDVFGGLLIAANGSTQGVNYNFAATVFSSIHGQVNYLPLTGAPVLSSFVGIEMRLDGIETAGAAVSAITSTRANGQYAFENLRPGIYTVTQTSLPLGYSDLPPSFCAPGAQPQGARVLANIVLQFGDQRSGCDFWHGSVLRGSVYADNDVDGVFGPGDTPLQQVRVMLFGQDVLGRHHTQTFDTLGDGNFGFGGLLTGSYRLEEVQPLNYFDGTDTVGTLGGVTSTNGLTGSVVDVISGIVYTPNLLGTGYTFAELRPARLQGDVFFDKNGNGSPQFFLAGNDVPVQTRLTLTGIDDLGQMVTRVLTASGFVFDLLRPGTYTLAESQPAGYTDGPDTAGSAGGTVADDLISNIVLAWGEVASGYWFAERKFGLSGRVFADIDNDGVYLPFPDGDDIGIPGVSVALSGTDNSVITFTLSADDGQFVFDQVLPGTYTLIEAQPITYASGINTAGTLGGVASNALDHISGIVVNTATQTFGEGYGFAEVPASRLSGRVFFDVDNDGVIDLGEPGISGVTMTLSGTSALGAAVSIVTRTQAGGVYTFAGLPNGVYAIYESQPDFKNGQARAGTVEGAPLGTALDAANAIVGIAIAQAVVGVEFNFGERPSSLGGSVFWDETLDGVRQPGETGLGPVTLRLRGRTVFGTNLDQSTATLADGRYIFEVAPGTYWLAEVQPFGYLDGGAHITGAAGVVSGSNTITQIVLGAADAGDAFAFSESPPGPLALAQAIGIAPGWLQSTMLEQDGPSAFARSAKAGVGRSPIRAFPLEGATYAYLGTGNMIFADQANVNGATSGLGLEARWTLTLSVPNTATCASVDFAFFSEEFPEFVGSAFNDNFQAWRDGEQFARDTQGNLINVNSVFGVSAANAAGSTYDGATPRLRAQVAVTPGSTSVFSFTISDIGSPENRDSYDSAVLLDRFRFGRPVDGDCAPGVDVPVSLVLSQTVSALPVCGGITQLDAVAGQDVYFCHIIENTGDITFSEHTLDSSWLGTQLYLAPFALAPGQRYTHLQLAAIEHTLVNASQWTAISEPITATASARVTVTVLDVPPLDPGRAHVFVQPGMQVITPGVPVSVAVRISDVVDLAAYQFDLFFDPAVVTVTGALEGGALGANLRSVLPQTPVLGSDYIRFGAYSIGAESAGLTEPGVLAWISFVPALGGNTPITLGNVLLANTRDGVIAPTLAGGQLVVVVSVKPTATPTQPPTPTLTSTPTSTITTTPMSTTTPTSTPTPRPTPSDTPAPVVLRSFIPLLQR